MEQARDALGEHRLALRRCQANLPAALEKDVADAALQRVETTLHLVVGEAGRMHPHAAVHVRADGLRYGHAARLQRRADRDARAAVEVRGERHRLQIGVAVEQLGRRLAHPGDRLPKLKQAQQFVDRDALDRHAVVGEDPHRNAVIVGQFEPVGVQAPQAVISFAVVRHCVYLPRAFRGIRISSMSAGSRAIA